MDFSFFMKLHGGVSIFCLQLLPLSVVVNLRAETAKESITLLKGHRGALVSGSVTHVRGHRGQDQPEVWEIATRMSDGERVFVITGKRIIADTVYSSGGGVVVDLRRLKVDSGDVFRVVNRAAVVAKVGFDSIDYELRAAPLGNAPLWIIHLRNFAGKDVGRLEVSGESGELLRSKWFKPRIAAREPIGPEDGNKRSVLRSYGRSNHGDENEVRRGERISAFAGETGQKLKRGIRAVGMGFNQIFNGQSAVSNTRSRYKPPTTSRKLPR